MMEEEPEKDSLVELRTYRSDGGESARGVGKGDEQEDSLMQSGVAGGWRVSKSGGSREQSPTCLDAVEELVTNSNVMPLLAVLDRVDLNITIQGKPLLSRLCTMNIPLQNHLHHRTIAFVPDQDRRTALHDAIAADDTLSAHWCMQRGIANQRDNFGNTPISEAIQLGRRSSFLLCLQFGYYDSEAPQICAKFNRVWELKVLRSMGYDMVAGRDSEHFTPLERAVQYYSYDAAEYLGRITPEVSLKQLETRTDSQGIIRLVQRVREESSFTGRVLKSIAYPFLQLLWIYGCTAQMEAYSPFSTALQGLIGLLLLLYTCLIALGSSKCTSQSEKKEKADLMRLLKAPEFPVLEDICAECLQFEDPNKDHCVQCGTCIQNYHFHTFTCVNRSNQIFWLLLEVTWLFLSLKLLLIFSNHLKSSHLLILVFNSSLLFTTAAILQTLLSTSYIQLLWFIFLLLSTLYRSGRCFQWLAMLVLGRTYQEINHTERYKKLYQIVRTKDGGYKNRESRLMQDRLCVAVRRAVVNAARYFLK